MAYRKILVPVDGSPTSNAGLREAVGLAKAQGASLQLVHVVDYHYLAMAGLEAGAYIDTMTANLTESGRRILKRAEETVRAAVVPVTSVLLESSSGPAADAIVRQAKKAKADAIVIGTHGRRGVRRLLMGSDAGRSCAALPCRCSSCARPGADARRLRGSRTRYGRESSSPRRPARPRRPDHPGQPRILLLAGGHLARQGRAP